MRSSQGLRAAFIATAVVNLLATPVISTLPALARHVDNGAQSLSILMAAYTGGAPYRASP
jgi:hypothetical protein